MMRTWGQKNICRQLGLVRIYSTQRPIKTHDNSLQNIPFRKRASPSAACRIIVNKIKNMLISLLKNASPCCRDCAPPCNIWRSHSPINLKLMEAGGPGGSWCRCFFRCAACMCCWSCCAQSDSWLILVVLNCLSVGYFHPFLFFNWRGTKSNLLHT